MTNRRNRSRSSVIIHHVLGLVRSFVGVYHSLHRVIAWAVTTIAPNTGPPTSATTLSFVVPCQCISPCKTPVAFRAYVGTLACMQLGMPL